MTRPSAAYEAAANKKWLDARPGRREAKQRRDLELKAARNAATGRLTKIYPGVFRKLYEEEAAKRDIVIGKRGRPKVTS